MLHKLIYSYTAQCFGIPSSFVTSFLFALLLISPQSFLISTAGWYTPWSPSCTCSFSTTTAISLWSGSKWGNFHCGEVFRALRTGFRTHAFSTQFCLVASQKRWVGGCTTSFLSCLSLVLTSEEPSHCSAKPTQSIAVSQHTTKFVLPKFNDTRAWAKSSPVWQQYALCTTQEVQSEQHCLKTMYTYFLLY